MTNFWFIISSIFIFLELINPGLFFFLALSLGALSTMLVQLQEMPIIHQYILFFVSSGIMFIFLNLFVKVLQKKKQTKIYASNIHLLIGKIVEITKVISDDTGYGQVDGETWMIKIQNHNKKIAIGKQALIIGVKGCHLQANLLDEI